jgi:hypothetical protein
MKSTLTFNTSAYVRNKGTKGDFNKLRDMLTESHCVVTGERQSNGDVYMVVNGNINEKKFAKLAGKCKLYEAEDYLLDADELPINLEDGDYDYDEDDDLESLLNDDTDEDADLDAEDFSEYDAEEDPDIFDEEFNDDVEEDFSFDLYDDYCDSCADDYCDDDYDCDFDEKFFDQDYMDDSYDDELADEYIEDDDIDECLNEALNVNMRQIEKRNRKKLIESKLAAHRMRSKKLMESKRADIRRKCKLNEHKRLVNGKLTPMDKALNEKKRGCCPPKKDKMVSLAEAMKAFKPEDQKKLDKAVSSIDDGVRSVKGQTIGAAEVAAAMKKLKAQQLQLKKIAKDKKENFKVTDVKGVSGIIKKMIEADPDKAEEIKKFRDSLTESVVAAISNKKKVLHENVAIDGVAMSKIKSSKLQSMLKEAVDAKKKYSNTIRNANGDTELIEKCKKIIGNKNKLIGILSEELSYRKLVTKFGKSLFESDDKEGKEEDKKTTDASEMSDDDLAALMSGSFDDSTSDSVEDSNDKKDDATEGDEEVDLARVVIELKDKESADELKDLCVEAGIPEDAIDIEEDSDEDDSDDSDDKSDEYSDDKYDDTNESIHYANIRKLFEADDESEDTETDDAAQTDDTDADQTDDADDKADESSVKFVLTNTDYIDELAQVLDDEYGISKEEFEEMIGGEIVKDEDSDEDTDADEDSDDKSEDDKEDKKDSEDDNAEEISADDIFGNM